MSCTLHVVSKSQLDPNSFHSRIVRASNRAKISSAPTTETLAYVLGLTMVAQWLECMYHLFSQDKDEFNIFIQEIANHHFKVCTLNLKISYSEVTK